ncbi:hypothetical protein DFH08DRAFT_1033773 [Mycena albidolilacea]|uniref:Uncharacterized protein n=1 Tax=Mycena albidolilacea TaxID=1033008 RepID=A0AAD6ZFM0_9AGAR|nr:hypothetical protein DFH08DRAFT_1033773 [Mycena albidolilacea]
MDNEFRWGDQRGCFSREGEVREDSQVNMSTSPRPTCHFDPAHFAPAAPRSSTYLVPLLALLKRVACSLAQMWQNACAACSKDQGDGIIVPCIRVLCRPYICRLGVSNLCVASDFSRLTTKFWLGFIGWLSELNPAAATKRQYYKSFSAANQLANYCTAAANGKLFLGNFCPDHFCPAAIETAGVGSESQMSMWHQFATLYIVESDRASGDDRHWCGAHERKKTAEKLCHKSSESQEGSARDKTICELRDCDHRTVG